MTAQQSFTRDDVLALMTLVGQQAWRQAQELLESGDTVAPESEEEVRASNEGLIADVAARGFLLLGGDIITNNPADGPTAMSHPDIYRRRERELREAMERAWNDTPCIPDFEFGCRAYFCKGWSAGVEYARTVTDEQAAKELTDEEFEAERACPPQRSKSSETPLESLMGRRDKPVRLPPSTRMRQYDGRITVAQSDQAES